jgi:hypothetical protein
MTPVFSVSQVSTARDCLAKWGYRYLDGLRETPNASAAIGTRVHEIAETYLRDGKLPWADERLTIGARTVYPGRIFSAGMHLLPSPRSVDVEGKIELRTANAQWVGYRDFSRPGLVGDHKTTGDLDAPYLLTAETLPYDPQAGLYSHERIERGEDPPLLDWVYYRTRGAPKAKLVRAQAERGIVRDVVGQLDADTIPLARLLREKPAAKDLDRNYSACRKYGGCPHRGVRCIQTTAQIWAGQESKMALSVMDRIKALKAAQAGGAAPAADVGPANAAPSAGTPLAQPSDLSDKEAQALVGEHLRAQGKPELAAKVESGFVNCPEAEGMAPLAEPSAAEASTPGQIEDRAFLKAKCVSLGLCTQSDRFGEARLRQLLAGAPGLPVEQLSDLNRTAAETCAGGEGTGGRMPGEAHVVDRPGEGQPPAPTPVAHRAAIGTLYVGCVPDSTYVRGDQILAHALESLRRQGVEQDYRFVEFGRGKALLADAVREHLRAHEYGRVVIDLRAPEMQDIVIPLSESAEQIVRSLG